MSHRRKNKGTRVGDHTVEQTWYKTNVKRQRRRKQLAKLSKKRNRKK